MNRNEKGCCLGLPMEEGGEWDPGLQTQDREGQAVLVYTSFLGSTLPRK